MPPLNATDAPDTRSSPDFIAGLRQNAGSILLVTVLVTAVAIGVSIAQPSRFTSTASVVLQDSGDTGASPNMATEKQIASSSAVAARVIQSLHLGETPVDVSSGLSVAVPVDASVVEFSYTAGDPREAQRRAQAFADAYLAYRHDALVRATQSANDLADVRISELENELNKVTRKQEAAKTHAKIEAYRVRANALFAQIGVEEQRAASAAGSLGASGDRLVGATMPTAPSQPKVLLNGLLGMFFGLSLGVLVALALVSLKRRLQTEDDVRDVLGTPMLASIPEPRRGAPPSPVVLNGASPAKDAYRELLAKLLSNPVLVSTNGHHPAGVGTPATPARAIAVVPLDHATAAADIAANLGAAVAMSGRSVLQLSTAGSGDAPGLLPPKASPGLLDVVQGRLDLSDAVVPTSVEGFRALPFGSPDGSWLLLDARSIQRVVADATALAEVVIIPTPPGLHPGVEATAFVSACDAVLYVGTLGASRVDEAARVRRELEPLGKQALGAVMFSRLSARRGNERGRRTQPAGRSTERAEDPSGGVGDPPRRKALRHVVRSRLSEHPNLYLPLARRRYPGPSPKVVSDDTELVIDGYTRSACTFAVYAFQIAQQWNGHPSRSPSRNHGAAPHGPVRIAHHVHAPAQLLEAARRGIPTIVVIREPEGTILSQVLREPHVSLRDALISYERFYAKLIPHANAFVAGEFREVTTDFGTVIRRLNRRFDTRYRTFRPSEENTDLCLDLMKERPTKDPTWRTVVLGFESGTVPLAELMARRPARNGNAAAVTDTWIPSKERDAAKDALRERWNASELSPLRERAFARYREFLQATGWEKDA